MARRVAQHFGELILEEGTHEIANHIEIIANVEQGRDVQIFGWIALYWRNYADNSKPNP